MHNYAPLHWSNNSSDKNNDNGNDDGNATAGVASSDPQAPYPSVNILITLLHLAISVFITVVNVLTIVTVRRARTLRTLPSMLVVSLAVTDLLVGLLVFISALSWAPVLDSSLAFSPTACVVRLCGIFISCSVSMVTVCLTAAERYLFIVHPYKHLDYVTAKVMWIVIATSWTIGLVFGIGPASSYRFRAGVRCDSYYVFGPAYSVYGTLTMFLSTCIPTLTFYTLIARLVLQKRRSVNLVAPQSTISSSSATTDHAADPRSASLRSKLVALKAPVVVFGVFFVSWSPHMVVNVVHDVGVELPRSTRVWVTSLGLFNSAMNFFVYLVLNRQFRKALPFRSCHRCSGSRNVTTGH